MTLLRAVFVLIASWTAAIGGKLPWAKRLNPVACENALAVKVLRQLPAVAPYDLFLESFKPWRREGDEIVGRAGNWETTADGHFVGDVGSVEWRVDPVANRMTYAFRRAPGDLGQLTTARRITKAALAAFTTRDGLKGFAVETTADRVVTTLPLSVAGVTFIIDAFNQSSGFSAFKPLDFERNVFTAREVERDGCLRFEYDVHREVMVSECVRAGTAAWLSHQRHLTLPAGANFDAIAHQITVDLPSPRGLVDVLANARRLVELVITLRRAGLDARARTEMVDGDVVRVVLPWAPVGLDAWHLLSQTLPGPRYDRPVLVEGLTAVELAEVSRVLDGLAPRVAYARSHPEHFLRAKPRPPPTAAQAESARRQRYPGETLPADMRRNPALGRAELLFSAFGKWRRAGDVWTAEFKGVGLIVHPGNMTMNVDFGRRADGTERAGAVLLALLRRRGSTPLDQVRVLEDGRRIEVTLGPVATRVLMETRDALGDGVEPAPNELESARLREWRSGAVPVEYDPLRAAAE